MATMHIRCGGFAAAVDAYARDDADLWFVSMLGNQQSVRALWARLLKGEPAVLSDDALSGGRFCTLAPQARLGCHFHATRLPVTGATHAILVPDAALCASEQPDFLMLARSDEEAPELHYRFLSRRMNLPLHDSWSGWLWQRGLDSGEVRPLDALASMPGAACPTRAHFRPLSDARCADTVSRCPPKNWRTRQETGFVSSIGKTCRAAS